MWADYTTAGAILSTYILVILIIIKLVALQKQESNLTSSHHILNHFVLFFLKIMQLIHSLHVHQHKLETPNNYVSLTRGTLRIT